MKEMSKIALKLWIIVVVVCAGLAIAKVALAVEVCADLDGDGIAEACIEVDDSGAHFPGSPPPPVPEVPDPVEE